jgi:hypothetical protein
LEEVDKALAQKHVKVMLSCQPRDAVLTFPDEGSGAGPSYTCPLTWWFLPGKHRVDAAQDGFNGAQEEIDVRERGDAGARQIVLAAVQSEVPTAPPPEPGGTTVAGGEPGPGLAGSGAGITKPLEVEAGSSHVLEWALMGAGLGLGIAGGVLQGVAYSDNEDLYSKYSDTKHFPDGDEGKRQYDAEYGDEIRPKKIAAGVLFGVGGAAVAAGAVLWVIREPRRQAEGGEPVSLAPLCLPQGGGAVMTWEW